MVAECEKVHTDRSYENRRNKRNGIAQHDRSKFFLFKRFHISAYYLFETMLFFRFSLFFHCTFIIIWHGNHSLSRSKHRDKPADDDKRRVDKRDIDISFLIKLRLNADACRWHKDIHQNARHDHAQDVENRLETLHLRLVVVVRCDVDTKCGIWRGEKSVEGLLQKQKAHKPNNGKV